MWECEEGHTVKTDKEWQHIRQVARHRSQTATFLCQRMQAQTAQLAERQYRLQALLYQLRKITRAFRDAHARQRDRETAALINILQRMSVSNQS